MAVSMVARGTYCPIADRLLLAKDTAATSETGTGSRSGGKLNERTASVTTADSALLRGAVPWEEQKGRTSRTPK